MKEKMSKFLTPNAVTTGLAMFAMFFGSGNLIFPVGIGQMAGIETPWAILGLFLTAVLIPFFTLVLMILFNGDYDAFFIRIGRVPGRIMVFIIIGLIGPFGVLPRCIAFSHSNFSIYFDNISLPVFAFFSSIIIFLFSFKTSRVVGLIGNFLTPILLFSLSVIIYMGLFSTPQNLKLDELVLGKGARILYGMVEGYKTFDVFASIFFATAIIPAFKNVLGEKLSSCRKSLMKLAIKSSLIGMFLLFSIYAGLSFVAAHLRGDLAGVSGDKLLGTIANITMGATAGLFSNLVVSFACLTTAITLAVVSADFFNKEVFLGKVNYVWSLVITMLISFIFACLGFDGIMRLVLPILVVTYPAVIALVFASAIKHFFGISFLKISFYGALAISLLVNII